jgi:hypothetical protein
MRRLWNDTIELLVGEVITTAFVMAFTIMLVAFATYSSAKMGVDNWWETHWLTWVEAKIRDKLRDLHQDLKIANEKIVLLERELSQAHQRLSIVKAGIDTGWDIQQVPQTNGDGPGRSLERL